MENSLLNQTIAVVRLAGVEIMKYYRDSFAVSNKSPDNPVTDADYAADALLKSELTNLLPQAGWLSEETVDNPLRLEQSPVWIVDPLDGTKEFVQGIPEFSVAVALVEEGRPVMAVIYNPAARELYHAQQGQGVYYNGQPVKVSDREALPGAQVDASRSEMNRGEFEPFAGIVELKVVGSIAYKLARVAAGQSDATWSRGPKHEWDICAGAMLVEEAGGRCLDLNGEPLRFNQPYPKANGVIAAGRRLFPAVLQALTPHGAARAD